MTPVVLAYRLTEDDVRRYETSGRVRSCCRICRDRPGGIVALAAIGVLLVGFCARSHGLRPALIATVATAAVLAGFGRLREAGACRRACRLARDLGTPLDVRLTASDAGIHPEPGPDDPDPTRTFAWSEVVEVERIPALTVLRLRTGGGILLIPDRAFPGPEAADDFARSARQAAIGAQTATTAGTA